MTTVARLSVGGLSHPIDRRLFGSFVEHLGRCIYTGIYEPGHPLSDSQGFREDVRALVKELGVTTIRYPGGNFVSGYRWEDGVGPRETRPRRLDLAWHSTETNEIGLQEFSGWLESVGSDLMYAINLGTRGIESALDVVEYANVRGGTSLSDQRAAHGHAEPYDIRMWCLGNEMDGPWQLGHSTALEYGRVASATARAIRQLDPRVELVVCGSSSSSMPTFGSWEREVLEACYDEIDFISCHAYYEPRDGDLASFLASAVDMDRFIKTVTEIADEVGVAKGSHKSIKVSFDEWNVWYQSRFENEERITDIETWPIAPRLLEDSYSVLDAVVFGGLLISLLRNADRVISASLAQLVNVIAPIMTEPGGPAWRQTTFYPFALTSRLARGVACPLVIDVPTTPTRRFGDVAIVDAVATRDFDTGSSAIFIVNRHQTEPIEIDLDVTEWRASRVVEAHVLHDADPLAANTASRVDRVSPSPLSVSLVDGRLRTTLPPISWSSIALS